MKTDTELKQAFAKMTDKELSVWIRKCEKIIKTCISSQGVRLNKDVLKFAFAEQKKRNKKMQIAYNDL